MNKTEALEKSLEYFNGDKLAAGVFVDKYALTTPEGDVLEATPDDMHKRLAREFARIEKKYPNPMSEDEIYGLLKDFKYVVAQGSPMAGIGNPYQVTSLSNCQVIDSPLDSFGGILKTDQEQAQLMKRRSGVGFDISNIRPKGVVTSNAARTTDGIGPFMERFSNTCREVAHSGRRGALMLTISVHHPEIETFINIKKDLTKVTGANISIRLSDEFMLAVKKDEEVQLRFPVDSKTPLISKMVSAKDLWDKIITSAHATAEPGLLFWDTVNRETPTHCYEDFKSVSTNPCFSGDTLIAVADGRNAVSIKQLAEEGKDVPVYSANSKTGIIEIKMGRNPRITGYDKKLVRITLDNGTHFDLTPDHKCMLKDGSSISAKDLKYGDSLSSFTKELSPVKKDSQYYYRVYCNTRNAHQNKIFEHRLIAKFHNSKLWQELYKKEKQNGWISGGLVIHHEDYNGLNNSPDNLRIMTFKDHAAYHAQHDNSGENNGRVYNVSNKEIKEHATTLTKNLNRRFSTKEWLNFAESHCLPKQFSEWRQVGFYKNPTELAKACAVELGLEHTDIDPRLVKTLQDMLLQGYEAEIIGNQVYVKKICEICKNSFQIDHGHREKSFCSLSCSLIHVNSDKSIAAKRIENRNKWLSKVGNDNKENQARIFSNLKFSLNREPLQKEWERACKQEKIPYRVGKVLKHGFKTWREVKEAGAHYNHKVISVIEIEGNHTVYNMTVDDNHTLSIVHPRQKGENVWFSGINVFQCGEIVLSPYDSCRLLLVNALSFVKNPFEKNAQFEEEKFKDCAIKAQRLMDDLVDLELECIEKIIHKIENDPEPQDVKQVELNLWNKIKNNCANGRRTGLGLTAIGDTFAALGVRYGSDESIMLTDKIYGFLAQSAYKSTVQLAKERGAFPIFNYELEKSHPFLQRIFSLDSEVAQNWQKYGRRNIGLTTTAPAGTVSVLTQTTSGIEPAFEVIYKRRKKISSNDAGATIDFIDNLGDKWQEYEVYHHQYKKWMDITGKNNVEESPYWKSRANDIDWVAKVKVQAAAQKWICHSISNTTNVPNNTSIDTVKEIYMTGWESGCKGVTVYRDGCRDGVLLTSAEKKEKKTVFETHNAPKRPTELPCEIATLTVNGEKWTFFVGLLEGKPYEIMGGLSKFVTIPKRVKKGKIVKITNDNVARYDFHYDFENGPEHESVIKDISQMFDNATNAAFTRTISLAMRHGAPIHFLIEQLLKGSEKDDDLFSFSRAVTRVLKQYIQDGTKASDKVCSNCGGNQLVYQEGCQKCLSCSSSKCG